MAKGSVTEGSGITFLSFAGGFIWDKKADETHKDFAKQEYTKADNSVNERQGARYADITGKIIMVEFRVHKEFGENINVTLDEGDERSILSISTNNRYSQDMMKALLKADLSKEIFIKPYDFIGTDKKRAQGISFRQDGVKLDLKTDVPAEFVKDAAWFKEADKKKIKRFFEDLSDWYVAEIEETIIPNFKPLEKQEPKAKVEKPIADEPDTTEEKNDEDADFSESAPKEKNITAKKIEDASATTEEQAPATPLKMKKILKAYIAENYEGETLPELSKEDLLKWYNLCLAEEELPFDEKQASAPQGNEVSAEDLDAQLNKLL